MKYLCIWLIFLIIGVNACQDSKVIFFDVVIVGGGASGVTAGIQAARLGSNTLIVEETPWLGGMLTSAGVSAVDGNYKLPAGIFGEFRDSLACHYGHADSLRTGWVSSVLFEPSVGNRIFKSMTSNEKKLEVRHGTKLKALVKTNDGWKMTIGDGIREENIIAKIIIDATELGDIAKMCGVSYDIGMESRMDTNEDIAPEKANNIIQDLTYVAVLKDYGKDVTIPRPDGYDSTYFACACMNEICIQPKEPDRLWGKTEMITYGKLPNNKYMINWPLEGNDYYINIIEMTSDERQKALNKAKNFTLRFLYFLQHEIGFNTLGLADDEFPTEDKLPFIPYHRESRRIHGQVRFTLNDITHPYDQENKLYRTCIAVGDYPVDHHHARYQGKESLPNLYFYPVPSYGLPMGTLIPYEVNDLLVAEKSISVSNLVNGTTRLQPVVMQIGQAAGIIAALAVKENKEIKEMKVRDVQDVLLEQGGYLLPYLDVPKSSPLFKPYQRIGSTGILKGFGKTVNWSNETWLRTDTLLLLSELSGLKEVYPYINVDEGYSTVTIKNVIDVITQIAQKENIVFTDIEIQSKEIFSQFGFDRFDMDRPVKRGEYALLVDQLIDPFHTKDMNILGKYQ